MRVLPSRGRRRAGPPLEETSAAIPRTIGAGGRHGAGASRREVRMKPSTTPALLAPNSRQSDCGSCGFRRFQAAMERDCGHRPTRRIPLNHAENGSSKPKICTPRKAPKIWPARFSRPLALSPVRRLPNRSDLDAPQPLLENPSAPARS